MTHGHGLLNLRGYLIGSWHCEGLSACQEQVAFSNRSNLDGRTGSGVERRKQRKRLSISVLGRLFCTEKKGPSIFILRL